MKASKPPETSAVQAPLRPHRAHQFDGARSERDAALDEAADHRGVEACEQRDALAQSRLEGDLAVHRARGDRRDLRP